jgi:hypothetical protein
MAAVPLGSRDPEVETRPGIAARRESGKVNMRRTEKGQPRRMVDYDTTITLPLLVGWSVYRTVSHFTGAMHLTQRATPLAADHTARDE